MTTGIRTKTILAEPGDAGDRSVRELPREGQRWFFSPHNFMDMLDEDDRRALSALATRRLVHKGQYIFEAGDRARRVFIVYSGRVKVYQISASGKEVILWFCFPGEIFGLAELSRSAERETFAQASVDMEILSIDQADFLGFIADRPTVAMNAIDVLSTRLRRLGQSVMNLATEDVSARLARLILGLAQSYGQRRCAVVLDPPEICVPITLTHQEIADMIGASRQTVTTTLNDFRRRGAIQFVEHHIHIHQPALLERILQSRQD